MINENLKEFYEKLAEAKKQESWRELLDIDGKVKDIDNQNIDIVNCCNNPFYFLYKIEDYKLNIGNYLAIRNLINGKNVILELPPLENKTTTVLGYIMHQLIFTDGTIVLESNTLQNRKIEIEYLKLLVSKLPEYIRTISNLDIDNRIIRDKDKNDDTVLCVYDDIYNKNNIKKIALSKNIPTIIVNRLDNNNWEEKLVQATQNNEVNRSFVLVRYNMFELGHDMEYAKELFKTLNSELDIFLKCYVL